MAEERDWKEYQRNESKFLGELIAWAATVFNTTEEPIEKSRLYGTTLLAHSIECARAIRLCISRDIPGPAFALARTQYEATLRGHIIVHEIDLEELNEFLRCARERIQSKRSPLSLPSIQIRGNEWRCFVPNTKAAPFDRTWRSLEWEIANLLQESVLEMSLLHDLTHSGLTQALQMLDKSGEIGPSYSLLNQMLLLYFAQRTVMFTIMTWPGAMQKYQLDIENRAQIILERSSSWMPHIYSSAR